MMLRVEETIEYEVQYRVITVYLQKDRLGKRIIARHKVDTTNDWELKVMKGDGRNKSFVNYSLEMVKDCNIESRINSIVAKYYDSKTVKLLLNGIKYEAITLAEIYKDLQHRGIIPENMKHDDTEVLTYLLSKYSVIIKA